MGCKVQAGAHPSTCCPQNYTSAPHCLEALQELYDHIHRYYDQVRPAALQWGEGRSRRAGAGGGGGRERGTAPQPRARPQGSSLLVEAGVWANLGRGEGGPRLGKERGFCPDASGRPGAAPAGPPPRPRLARPWVTGGARRPQAGHPLLPWQIIGALEEDPVGQKMQLACRLQQVAALVENKVTDL